ncbi:hypothetical protein GCM10009092_39800 [Bowmanella denitrificans]|uniref:Acetolactate synthase n=1 Tax=Bowmanella denitrificans TaxID=366582 RepID=A0ABN0XSN8_9ALTE|nr:acetolactate synthase 2 small subunit [Bowmanella denitrificans]
MNYQLEMLLSDQPAVLERVLQTTRYRGFRINQLNMQPAPEQLASRKLKVSMQVSGKQPITILTSQLHKLYDLASLECRTALSPSIERQSTLTQALPRTA